MPFQFLSIPAGGEKTNYVYVTTQPPPSTTSQPKTEEKRSDPYVVSMVVCTLFAVGGGLVMVFMFVTG